MVRLLALLLIASLCIAQEKPTPVELKPLPKLDVTLSKVKIVERINILERQNDADKRQIESLRSQIDAANKKILSLANDIQYRSGAIQALKLTVIDSTLFSKELQ